MNGKVIVITGASSGIGAAVAQLVGQRGASPVLSARRQAELHAVAARSGPTALPVVADVTHRDQVQRIVAVALEHFGRVDVWINNAGRGISRPVADLTDEDFDDMMLINAKSALYGMQAVLPHMKERQRGHIINMSSMLGRIPFASVRSAYGAAKHALLSLTANLRLDLRVAFPDIHVSSVIPGVVATDFGLHARHGGPDSRALPFAQTVEDVAHVVAELIEHPRAEVYTRPIYKQQVAAYYGAEDVAVIEAQPPFVLPPR
jgi:NAD(P)-dependent dehydrogenase (short-subunit alcohol dehydrogenase family)